MAITQIMNEHERLSILHCLAAMDDYAANNSIIKSVCSQYGNTMTMDKIGTHLFWLKEQGLVALDNHESYTIAKITQRGLDVEKGLATQPGVKRPGPR
jgi:DNA-binding transcriptional ArsR family regulator